MKTETDNNMTTSKRVTKKDMYINSLTHDIDFLSISIIKGTGFWWQGNFITKFKGKVMLAEYQKELGMILADQNYKPWKEFYKALGE